jgi:hypothetical protein
MLMLIPADVEVVEDDMDQPVNPIDLPSSFLLCRCGVFVVLLGVCETPPRAN